MKLAHRVAAGAAIALGLFAVASFNTQTTFAVEKFVICHATGSDGNPYVGILVSAGSEDPSLLSNNGHLDENGSPLSGHEHDILLGPGSVKADCGKLPPPK